MKKYHPDLYLNSDIEIRDMAENKCKAINIAYEYLSHWVV
jgi:DnaJ-class molecular chaperone